MTSRIELVALDGIPEVSVGDDLSVLIADAAGVTDIELTDADVLVVTQKVVSKAEGRLVDLVIVDPSPMARDWAELMGQGRPARSSSCCASPHRSSAWRPAA